MRLLYRLQSCRGAGDAGKPCYCQLRHAAGQCDQQITWQGASDVVLAGQYAPLAAVPELKTS